MVVVIRLSGGRWGWERDGGLCAWVCFCVKKKKKRNQSGRDILRDCVVGNRWLGSGSRGGF